MIAKLVSREGRRINRMPLAKREAVKERFGQAIASSGARGKERDTGSSKEVRLVQQFPRAEWRLRNRLVAQCFLLSASLEAIGELTFLAFRFA